MNEYTQSLGWADVERGMTVELRHPDYPTVVGEFEESAGGPAIFVNGAWYYELRGWSLWVEPDPAVVNHLPTEPGYYLDREGDLWRLVAGQWVFPESDDFAGKHERYAPFTRLLTEAEWEAKRGANILKPYPKIGGGTYTSLGGQRYTLTNEKSRP